MHLVARLSALAYIAVNPSARHSRIYMFSTITLHYCLYMHAHAPRFPYVDRRFSWFRLSTQFVQCRELLQSPRTCRFAPLASPAVLELSLVVTLSLDGLICTPIRKLFHCPTLHSMGAFVLPHGRPHLRSFAWAVSPVTVTAPLANLAI